MEPDNEKMLNVRQEKLFSVINYSMSVYGQVQ
jgi:hypothetical protein